MDDSKDKFEDHIELMDYLRVIWKWKYLIMVGTAVCALAAAVISIGMPKVYRVETILQPAVAGISESGEKIYIDSPSDIKALIEGKSFESEITPHLQTSDTRNPANPVQFRVNIPANTGLLKISCETKTVDAGVNILNKLIESLSKKNIDKINYLKNKYEKQIQQKKAEIAISQDELDFIKIIIDNIEKRLSDLDKEMQEVKINTKIMTNYKDKYIKNMNEEDIFLTYLHINTIQQNLNLRTTINNQIFDNISELSKEKKEIRKIQKQLKIILNQIEDLQQKKNVIENIQVFQQPTSSLYASYSRVKRNIMLAAAAGLFINFILAFFLEYFSKYKSSKLK